MDEEGAPQVIEFLRSYFRKYDHESAFSSIEEYLEFGVTNVSFW